MSSGFITESEAAEIRKNRQEEWEKVRKADDPLERPEEKYDCRSLYERLNEQKQRKQDEYEEAHKLKNMIKGLDDDEIEFLDLVDRTKLEADRRKEIEEERELNDYRNRVATLQEKNHKERLHAEISVNKPKVVTNNRISQQKLLKGVVVKKKMSQKRKMSEEENSEPEPKRREFEGQQNSETPSETTSEINNETHSDVSERNGTGDATHRHATVGIEVPNSSLRCVAILPGLGCYSASSSDEEDSTDSEIECFKVNQLDFLGRKLEKKQKETILEGCKRISNIGKPRRRSRKEAY